MQTQHQFTQYIRDPDNSPKPADIEERRMNMYRDLLFTNISNIISDAFPVLKKITSDKNWEAMCRDFFVRHPCHSPYFSEVSQEFIQYLQNERREASHAAEDFSFLLELAHYEWAELFVSVAEDAKETKPVISNPLNQVLTVANAAMSLAYQYPVHRISPDYIPTEPDEQPTFLVVYRDSNDKVGFLETNPMTHALLEKLSNNSSLTCQQILTALADEMQHPNPDIVIQGGASILLDFVSRGIVVSIN
ncbi:MAG: DUF2063 domain-containing protein [Piscirickettsiaceae bacterium]|nr:MAG: DUF2063 domain-containing protein [Piscirickettsiaceae bacterium]